MKSLLVFFTAELVVLVFSSPKSVDTRGCYGSS